MGRYTDAIAQLHESITLSLGSSSSNSVCGGAGGGLGAGRGGGGVGGSKDGTSSADSEASQVRGRCGPMRTYKSVFAICLSVCFW
jgi:hypothetical protein